MEFDDRQLAERLVGTWISYPSENADVVSTATYNPDGTGTEVVRMNHRPESDDIRVEIEWSINEGVLTMNSLASNNPSLPVGMKLADRIVSISEDKLVSRAHEGYMGFEGEEIVKVRVKEEGPEELNDQQLAERLVGTWGTNPEDAGDVVSRATYNADGTGTEVVEIRNRPEMPDLRIDFEWSIDGKVLTTNSVGSSHPEVVPVGMKLSSPIVSISADRFVSRTGAEFEEIEGRDIVKVRLA